MSDQPYEPTEDERRGFRAEQRDDEERERLRDEGRWGWRGDDTPTRRDAP